MALISEIKINRFFFCVEYLGGAALVSFFLVTLVLMCGFLGFFLKKKD